VSDKISESVCFSNGNLFCIHIDGNTADLLRLPGNRFSFRDINRRMQIPSFITTGKPMSDCLTTEECLLNIFLSV